MLRSPRPAVSREAKGFSVALLHTADVFFLHFVESLDQLQQEEDVRYAKKESASESVLVFLDWRS